MNAKRLETMNSQEEPDRREVLEKGEEARPRLPERGGEPFGLRHITSLL